MNAGRFEDIIRLLIKYPMTARMIVEASAGFTKTYTNMRPLQEDLLHMVNEGFLNRQAIPHTGPGQSEYLYFLKPKAKRFVSELEHIGRSNVVFRGFSESSPYHNLEVSRFMSFFERSAGELKERVSIVNSIRPRHFRATVNVKKAGTQTNSIIPDYTQIVLIDGKPNLLFVELQRHASVICPVSPQSLTRSFAFKITKYQAFKETFQNHPIIQRIQRDMNIHFMGFRVLVIITKGEHHQNSLLNCAKDMGCQSMFYFARMEALKTANLFTDAVFKLPNGQTSALIFVRKEKTKEKHPSKSLSPKQEMHLPQLSLKDVHTAFKTEAGQGGRCSAPR